MQFYDVSDWMESALPSTKGTRDKLLLTKPQTDDTYFLKFPMIRGTRDYSPENWSEVIAFEVGTALGFNVLRYDLAAYKGRVGCLSKNMINLNKNESLIEGHSILSRFDSTYDPSNKGSYNRYTFDFVQKALQAFDSRFYLKEFIRTLIFDAIIGNSDRHQSNWGIIQSIHLEVKPNKKGFRIGIGKSKGDNIYKVIVSVNKKAAPIYDSGCCLGREYGEAQIQQHLDIQSKFDKYIRNGVSELRTSETEGKPSHEELLQFIKNTNSGEWKSFIEQEINRVLQTYKAATINELIFKIDNGLPDQYKERYGLSIARKEFIFRVIDTRINKLKNI